MNLILASASPRRAELLTRMGVPFTVQPANTEELLTPGLTPQQEVLLLSRQKGEAVYETLREPSVVLSADTIVVLEGHILGKPADEADARKMLKALSGRSHLVLTGVTVLSPSGTESRCVETEVRFRALTQGEIDAYIATGEPMDKAGAYGIQGYAAMFAEGITGDYYNVMGLPVCETAGMLRRAGIPMMGDRA